MHITALGDGKFGVGILMSKEIKGEWLDDGSLSLRTTKKSTPISVTTFRGQFIEAVDEKGEIVAEGGDGQLFWFGLRKKPLILRYKSLPDPGLSKSAINETRKTVTRYLVDDHSYSLDIPDDFAGAIKWMQDRMKEIPPRCRKSARFCFDTTTEYGDTYPHIEITYDEPETDAEVIERIQIETERARLAENAERAKYDALKDKFESTRSSAG